MKPFRKAVMDALGLFKRQDHVEKIKTQITSESMPSNDTEDLFEFLYNHIAHI